jgi:hypothetical protein
MNPTDSLMDTSSPPLCGITKLTVTLGEVSSQRVKPSECNFHLKMLSEDAVKANGITTTVEFLLLGNSHQATFALGGRHSETPSRVEKCFLYPTPNFNTNNL